MNEAEQNRLIIENADLCPKICADYRSGDIEFEELLAEAQLALVDAARKFNPLLSKFSAFASLCINHRLMDLKDRDRKHGRVDSVEVDGMDGFSIVQPMPGDAAPSKVWEWDAWADSGNARAICDWFNSIAVMPGDVMLAHDKIRHRQERFASAVIGLKPLERKLVNEHFSGVAYGDIARLHRMSYRAVVRNIERALRLMREAIAGQDRAPRAKRRAVVLHFKANKKAIGLATLTA
jgi:RNA polymerase sigma factor (sigma-70 family)